MINNPNFVSLTGSDKSFLPQTKIISNIDPNETIQFTILIRRGKDGMNSDSDDCEKVKKFTADFNLKIIEESLSKRSIIAEGKADDVNKAFNVDLKMAKNPEFGEFRARSGSIYIPQNLSEIIVGILGLDDRQQAQPFFRIYQKVQTPHIMPLNKSQKIGFTAVELSKIYKFPQKTGKNQVISIIELGGGYRESDLKKYFKDLGLKTTPKVISIGINGAKNAPEGNANGADGEVALDIEVAGAVANSSTIVVYFAPNDDRGFFDAINEAVHSKKYKPNAISISWGGTEDSFTEQSKLAYDETLMDAMNLGINVFCSAGDNGSSEGQNDKKSHVTFPASASHAISCGGTNLQIKNGKPIETVWNKLPAGGATGGGVSDFFSIPTWQENYNIPKSKNDGKVRRGVPDISAVADPQTGYKIFLYDQEYIIGGTSAVSPLLSAMNVLMNEEIGENISFFLEKIYKIGLKKTNSFNDITIGNNGDYKAQIGWDACTGLGTPVGDNLLGELKKA